MFNEDKRSDVEIQDAIKALFLGLAPERTDELGQMWDDYQLQFCLFTDNKGVLLAGGAYRSVHFNQRSLRVIWVSAFAAWEAFACAQSAFVDGEPRSIERLKELLDLAIEVRDAKDPETVSLGKLPEPGSLSLEPQLRAPAELAMFATGWALLHEVRHLKHQQEGTSTVDGDDSELAHAEELSCDCFAAEYITGNIAQYASFHEVDQAKVRMKRSLGVYFGVFALIILGYPNWKESASHPSVSDRLRAIRSELSADGLDEALCVAALALAGLKQVWPDAPDFVS